MMIEKEYYQLDDLKPRFNITESDIKYLISEKKIIPFFYVNNTAFIIGGWRSTSFIGYANVTYEGLVAIPEKFISELIFKGKVTPNFFNLPNSENIKIISTEYKCDLQVPNNYIQEWSSKDIKQVNWSFIPAKIFPYRAPTLKSTFKNFLLGLATDESRKDKYASMLEQSLRDSPDHELTAIWRTVSYSDVCIRHSDLIALGLCGQNSSSLEEKIKPTAINTDLSALERILVRILLTDRTLSAKPVFKMLVLESNLDDESRRFDCENILLDHVEGVIIWKDSTSLKPEKRCTLSTLANKLSKVRKTLYKDS